MQLTIEGLTKRFGSFTANDAIDLSVEPGEIHCLLGENGAGKSTLMNMLYGLLEPTEGRILVDGEPVAFASPGDAIAAGIGMVHQHFMLVPVFTVAENVMLGHENTKGLGVLDLAAARAHVRAVADRFGFQIDRRQGQGAFAGPVLSIPAVFRSRAVVTFLAVWMVVNLVMGLGVGVPGSENPIAWEAHIGGFLAGFFLVRLFDRRLSHD